MVYLLKNMAKNINLLTDKREGNVPLVFKKQKFLRTIAVLMLFSVSAISIVIFILIALSPLPQLKQEEENLKNNLVEKKADIAKLFIIKERLSVAKSIIDERSNFHSEIEKLQAKMPVGVSVTSIDISDELISVTVSSRSLSLLNTFLDQIISAVTDRKEFSKVSINNLTTSSESYLLTISVESL